MIGLLKKPLCQCANQDERTFEMHLLEFVESAEGPEQGYRRCLADVSHQG